MEVMYKQQYLKDISKHAEIMIYDWSNYGDAEVVIEDIERMDFDQFEKDPQNKKMRDWRFYDESEACETRIKFTRDKSDLMTYFNIPRYDVPELVREADNGRILREVWYNVSEKEWKWKDVKEFYSPRTIMLCYLFRLQAPGMRYHPGYNEDMGDTGILTKTAIHPKHSY